MHATRIARLVAAGAVAALAAVQVPGAHAADPGPVTVYGSSTLQLRDYSGLGLDVTIAPDGADLVLHSNLPLTIWGSCAATASADPARPHAVRCTGARRASLRLGAGDDRADITVADRIVVHADGGSDTVIARTTNADGRVTIRGDRSSLDAGNDVLSTNVRGNLDGGPGDDVITGSAYRDHLDGDEGNDTISGGAGRDILKGEEGDDVIDAADGLGNSDIVRCGPGNDTLHADADDFTLWCPPATP